MKLIFRIGALVSFIFVLNVSSIYSQSLSITGGNDHAVVICAEGYMYAWGSNKNNQLGLLPPYNTSVKVWEPQAVNTGGLTFSQVTAGSGSHNVALSCNGIVYSWGDNSTFQTGQTPGGVGAVVTQPMPVPKGQTPGYSIDGSSGGDYLGNIKMIAASTAASFALLNTGEVVGWGGNGDGGKWIATATPNPFYIKKTDGTRLTNIIHISGGDNNALFLEDADGDGLGTLYSIGNWNGRGGDGSAQEYTAAPVLDEDGNPLTTIKMSGIMDVGGFAVDGVTGYVYGWGNGGWGCSNGIPNNQTTTYASKISSGEYQTISGEEYLTDVLQVMGGNGYGAAITKEGYLLYWGNNTPVAGNGGAAPRPFAQSDACKTGPIFAEYCDGTRVSDAVAISRGDMWGFMINDANEYFVWGSNSQAGSSANYVGTLGLGDQSITYVDCVTPLAIPCELPDQCPEAYMVGPMYKCAGQPAELFSGFTTPVGLDINNKPLSDRYYFRWYKDGVLLNSTTKDSPVTSRRADIYNNTQIDVQEVGTYKVEIEYIDVNVPCNACQVVEATIEVLDKEMPIEDMQPIACVSDPLNPTASDQICFEFLSDYTVDSEFEVYASQTGGVVLESLSLSASSPNATFCVTGDNVVATKRATDTIYTVYVEDKTTVGGKLLENFTLGTSKSFQSQKLIIEVWKPIVLSTFDIVLKSYYGTATGTITPYVYAVNKNTNGQEITGPILFTGPTQTLTYEDVPTTVTVNFGDIELTANPARGTKYILGFTFTGNANMYEGTLGALAPNSPILLTPLPDNIDGGTALVIGGLSNSGDGNPYNASVFSNINFESLSAYDCGRMPVTAKYFCPPCTQPLDITISSTDADNYLCPTQSTVLSTAPNQVDISQFDFTWYKGTVSSASILDASVVKPTEASMVSSSFTVNNGQPGTYYIRVRDKDNPTSAECFKEASIIIRDAVKPTYTITGGGDFCDGDVIDPVVVNFTAGVQPYTITSTGPGAGAKPPISATSFELGTAEGIYALSAISDLYCTGDIAAAQTKTITVYPIPEGTITATNSGKYCGTTSNVNLSITPATGIDLAGATYQWTRNGSPAGTSATINGAVAGTYVVTISKNGCPYVSDPFEVIQYNLPSYSITGGDTYCANDVLQDVEITFTGATPIQFDELVTGSGLSSSSLVYTISNPSAGVYRPYNIIDANGCAALPSTVNTEVIINPIPVAPTSPDKSYCVASPSVALVATGEPTAVFTWYTEASPLVGTTTAPIPSTAGAGTQTYWVTQSLLGCESDRTEVTVIVNDNLTPTITATPGFEVCAGNAISLGTEAYHTYTWSGTAVTNSLLNSTSIQTPEFSATATANTYTVRVDVTDINGCEGFAEETIIVNPIPTTSLSAVKQAFCVDVVTPETITATITPTMTGTGVWSGSGLESHTNTTAGFNPSTATTTGSPHTITYTFTSDAGCPATPSTIVMTVNPLPNVSISPSRVNACESGNNSGVITITATGTAATGTLVYSSPTATVNTSTGELNPTTNAVGTHIIQLDYEDVNGCTDVATTTVEVHALPTVSFGTNPTEVCYNSGIVTLDVAPTPGSGTSYSFTGTSGATSANFNPLTASVGTNNFTYTYTDNNLCRNSDTYSIDVIAVNPPTVDAPNPKTVVILPPLSVPPLSDDTDLSATPDDGTNFLDWMPEGGGSVLSHDALTYATGLDETTPEGTYKYAVREGKVIAGGNTCYSDSVIATIVMSNCPALTPIVVNPYYCVGTSDPTIATAVAAPMSSGGKISWLSINPVGLTDPNLPEILVDDNLTYSSSISTALPGTEQLYVAEYDATNNCWSVGGQVTIHVVDTPNVTISSLADICTRDGFTEITVNPTSGTLSASITDGFNAAARTWTPTGTDLVQTNTFTYVVTQNHGTSTGATTCQSTVTSQTTAHYIEPPTPVNKSWLITKIDEIPANFMEATLTTGTTVNWYADQAKTQPLILGSLTYTPDKVVLQSEVDAITPTPSSYPKTYWITQVNAEGCESEPVAITLTLVDCPFDAPSVVGEEKCVNQTLNPISASTSESVVEWKWYQDDQTTPIANNNATYTHGVSNATHGTTRFYVSYTAIETQSGDACESPKTAVDVVVNQLPDVSITVPPIVCQNAGDIVIPKSETSYNGVGSGVWAVDGAAAGITTAGVFKPNFKGEVTDTYTISYTYTDAKGCVNSAQGDVLVQFTEAPTTVGHTSMIDLEEPVVLTANTLPGAGVKWYAQATGGTSLSTDNPWTTPDDPKTEVEKCYWASQTVNGCESTRTTACVSIIDCPVPAPIVNIASPICNYEDTPEIIATVNPTWLAPGGRPTPTIAPEFRIYTQATGGSHIEANTTGVYQPIIDKTTAGTHRFWVSEYNGNVTPQGCEGPRTAVVLDVYRTAPVLVNSVDPICDGEPNRTFTVNGRIGDIEWHVGATAPVHPALSGAVAMGESFTPSSMQIQGVGTHSVYAVHKVNGCVSEPAEGTIEIKAIPDAPSVTGNEICAEDANLQICATPSAGGTVSWFQTTTSTSPLRVASCYTPTVTAVQTHTFYALQEVNGCKSVRVPVEYEIKRNPDKPTITVSQSQVCENEGENPIFTAEGEPGSTIKWYRNDGTPLPDGATYTHIISGAGTYTYLASQEVNGCEGPTEDESVEVIATPTPPTASSKAMCESDNVIPTFNSGDSRTEWYRDPGAEFELLGTGSMYTPESSIVGSESINFYLKTRDRGCVSDVSVVSLQVIPKPQISLIGDSKKCVHDEGSNLRADISQFFIHPSDNIIWNSPQATFQVGSQTLQIEMDDYFTEPGTYDIRVQYRVLANEQLSKYCSSDYAVHTYTINDYARSPIVVNTTICQGEDIAPLQAIGSPNISWRALDSEPEYYENSTKYIFDNAELSPGIYRFELLDIDPVTRCRSEIVEYSLEVFPAANPTIYGDDSVCAYDSEIRYYTNFAEGSEYIWSITNGQTMYIKDDSYKNIRYVDWSNPGYDTIRVTEITRGLCIDSAMLVVKTAPYPETYFSWSLPGAQNSVEFRDSTIQDSIWALNEFGELESTFITYDLAWNFGKNPNDLVSIDSLVPYEKINNPYLQIDGYRWGYWDVNVTAINSFGCKTEYADNIFVDIQTGLYVPNAFAPLNPAHGVRFFQPKGFNLEAMEIWVYDTWGNLVWYSNEVENGNFVGQWNGTYNGKPLKSDTYIWKIEARFMDGQKWKGIPDGKGGFNTYGSLMLIR